MRSLDVIWTALPNGRDGAKLKLSVHVAPRLQTDEGLPVPTLAQFADFLDWPVHKIRFDVFVGAAGPFPATVATSPGSDSALWKGLFKGTTFVRPHTFDDFYGNGTGNGANPGRLVRSYPARHIRTFLQNVYTSLVAASPTEHPDFQAISSNSAFGTLGFVARDKQEVKDNLLAELERELKANLAIRFQPLGGGGGGTIKAPASDPTFYTKAFLQLETFHKPRGGNNVVHVRKPVLSQGPDRAIDFHQMLSMANNHPALLRLLGLVIDLEFTPSGATLGNTTVRVVPHWESALGSAKSDWSPYTNTTYTSSAFMARPRASDPDLVDGSLPFDDENVFQVIEIDHDGAALKALDFANNLERSRLGGFLYGGKLGLVDHHTDDTPAQYAPPTLRSGGISVSRDGAAYRLVHMGFAKAKQLNDNFKTGPVYLDAEDVTRGYVVHVFDSITNEWHSLTSRLGTYDFVDIDKVVQVDDEAAITLAPTTSPTGTPDDLYQQETLFVWTGWSLAAQRPGKTLVNDPHPANSPPTARYENTADQDFRLQIRYKAKPGSLPRLRFGATYQVRARAVDLAGNPLFSPIPQGADPHASQPLTYRRFEPLQAPVVLLREPRTEGETVERMVIRSNYNVAAEGDSQRHVSPSLAHEMMAETHGLFDDATNITTSAFTKFGLDDGAADGSYLTSDQGKQDPNDFPGTRYFDVNHLKIPFLPDPLARGAGFKGLPGTPANSVFPVSFVAHNKEWPDYRTVRLVMQEGTGPPTLDPTGRVLTVMLSKAEVARVRVSCLLDDAALAQMGVWNWLSPKDQAANHGNALNGQLWALTPFRELVLVHAVRQPLKTPEFISLPPPYKTGLGQTFAEFRRGILAFSRKSTSQLHVFGSWPEAVDAGPGSPVDPTLPPHPTKTGFAYDIPVLRPPVKDEDTISIGDPHISVGDRHEFHDTKYRHVTYSVIATTKFGEYFVQRVDVALTGLTPVVVDPLGFVTGTVRVSALDHSASYVEGKDFVVDDAAGSVARASASSAIPSGATVEVAYIHPPITRKTVAPVTVHIPNSARPAAPKVLYIVPTWQRSRHGIPGSSKTTRTGGSLRVYLDRPWWSSGEGELLGAVLWPGPPPLIEANEPPEQLKPFVSRWGVDPIHASGATTLWPTLDRFPRRIVEAPTLRSLDELPSAGASVLVAGHEVGFDSDRKLWYCDIDVDPGHAYTPFIRLALARYQPISLDGAHLSRVVMADFIQTVPDRSVTVTSLPFDPTLFQVTVSGLSFVATRAADGGSRAGPGTIRATVEQRSRTFAGDLGWEQVPGSKPLFLGASVAATGDATWSTRVQIPHRRWPFRLVLEEFEVLSADPQNPFSFSFATGSRLVYTEIIPLTPDRVGLLHVVPTAIDFGGVKLGVTSDEKTVTVSNAGTLPLTIGAIKLVGGDSSMFKVLHNHATGVTLSPGQSRTFQVDFTPAAPGERIAQVQIFTNGVGNPGMVNLKGLGLAPELVVTPASLNFGPLTVGTMSTPQTVKISNVGNDDLVLGDITLAGIGKKSFKLKADCSNMVVPPGGSCAEDVSFEPLSVGLKQARLVIPSNTLAGTTLVPLTGTGTTKV